MLCAGLSDSSSKVQVSAVNILNLSLSQPDAAAELASYLQAEESTLLAALSGMLDHSLALLRAKALATIMLLCRWVDHPFSILLKGRACDMCVHFHRSALRRLLFGLKVLEGGCGTQGVGVKLVKLASNLDVDQDSWLGPPCAASTCREQLGFPVMAEVLPPPPGFSALPLTVNNWQVVPILAAQMLSAQAVAAHREAHKGQGHIHAGAQHR